MSDGCYGAKDLLIRVESEKDEAEALEKFTSSAWFTRGWPLQGSLEPRKVWFFNLNWECVEHIEAATGIEKR